MNWWVCWNLVCTIFISWLLCVLTNPCYIHHWWQKCEWDVLSVSSHLLSHWLLLLYFQCLPTCIRQDTVLFETVSLITLGTFSDPSLHCHIHLNPSSAELCLPQTLLPPQLATCATWNIASQLSLSYFKKVYCCVSLYKHRIMLKKWECTFSSMLLF